MTESEFRQKVAVLGCPEPLLVDWPAGRDSGTHAHDFDAHGLVVAGSFTLSTPEGIRVLAVGDSFALAAGIPHSEKVGPQDTRLLAARILPQD
ncbi:MAG: hypothetical protein RL434_957 [Pseudomonadota bacterium]